MCAPTFAILSSKNAVRQNPDIIEDFFRICRRWIFILTVCSCSVWDVFELQYLSHSSFRCSEKAIDILLKHPRIEDVLKCSLICCASNSHQAGHAVFAFWSAFLEMGAKVWVDRVYFTSSFETFRNFKKFTKNMKKFEKIIKIWKIWEN